MTVPFLTASLLGHLLSHIVRMVDCHAGFFPLELHEKQHTWEDPLYTSRGHRLLFPNKILSLKIFYVLANGVDPDEMPHSLAFHRVFTLC